MSIGKYHLKDAVQEVAAPLFKDAGFVFSSKHGDYIFRRAREDGLDEVIAFCTGKYRTDVIVDIALVRPGRDPFDAFPVSRKRLTEDDKKVGVRDPLGRIIHGDKYFTGRDGFTWESEEDLRDKVLEMARLALRHGPHYWDKMAKRLVVPPKRGRLRRHGGQRDIEWSDN